MKIDPSSQQTDYSAMDAAPVVAGKPAKKPTKTVYPDLTLRGDAADQIIAAHQAGETFDADVTFKVTGIHQKAGGSQPYGDENESRVELEIINIEKEDETEPDEPEEDAGSAVDSYLANKGAAAPAEED